MADVFLCDGQPVEMVVRQQAAVDLLPDAHAQRFDGLGVARGCRADGPSRGRLRVSGHCVMHLFCDCNPGDGTHLPGVVHTRFRDDEWPAAQTRWTTESRWLRCN